MTAGVSKRDIHGNETAFGILQPREKREIIKNNQQVRAVFLKYFFCFLAFRDVLLIKPSISYEFTLISIPWHDSVSYPPLHAVFFYNAVFYRIRFFFG